MIYTAKELMENNLIVKHRAGSHAYGTSLPTSDMDFRGIFVGGPLNIRTPFYPLHEATDETEEDTVLYELSTFMKLATDCNPNIIETLWVDKDDITYAHPAYYYIREYAPELLSSKIAFTTSGYALSQLKRIKGHNKWINNPQSEKPPRQIDFVSLVHNFTDEKIFKLNLELYWSRHRLVPFGNDIYGLYGDMSGYSPYNWDTFALNVAYDGDTNQLGTPLFLVKFNKDVYNEAKQKWEQYWEWKKNRNEVRSELEVQFGYDTKHAMHLVRLLRMGVEALRDGEINVKRPDAEELLAIRNGAWTYEQVVSYAEEMDRYVREDLYKETHLPKKPNIHLAANLIIEVQNMIW